MTRSAPAGGPSGIAHGARFVTTRYQGSKQRALPLIAAALGGLTFDSAIDLFGGTGSVAWLLKSWGKRVRFNDVLASCFEVGTALVENSAVRLGPARPRALLARAPGASYDDFIARTFSGVFYRADEDAWLDVVAQNVARVEDRYARALARFALFQACLQKRPFNLFHRANLSVRTRDVPRTFGNKATWETPFEELFLRAAREADEAVFDNGRENQATREDALTTSLEAELVYLDPPYVRADGQAFDYLDGYHFLEGLVEYDRWADRIDRTRKHLPYARSPSPFTSARHAPAALAEVIARARDARYVVVSYREDGAPSIPELEAMLEGRSRRVRRFDRPHGYALSKRRSTEVVLVAERR